MAKKLQTDKWLFASLAGLVLFGLVMVYSASAMIAVKEGSNQYYYLAKQAIWVGIGFLAMLFAMNFDYHRYYNRAIVYGLLAVTIVMLVAVFGFPRVNGAQRWIKFAGFSIQPSEVAKLALMLFLAYYLEKRKDETDSFLKTLFPCLLVAGVLGGLVLAEPDLGTALMLGVICLTMCYTSGVKVLHLSLAIGPALVAIAGALFFVPWRFARLMAFLDPWADPQNKGFQVVQSLIAIGSGGLYGIGFAQGKQKMFYLPFAHSDFIFAVIGEELGLFGALAVILVFALLLWRGIRAALLAPDKFGMILGIGIVTSIVVQALFNMSVALSLLPTKGIPLPFISYGGSSLVPTLFAAGILLNISQYAGSRLGVEMSGKKRGSARKMKGSKGVRE
jgi:cell division protein FtsW